MYVFHIKGKKKINGIVSNLIEGRMILDRPIDEVEVRDQAFRLMSKHFSSESTKIQIESEIAKQISSSR